MRRLINIVEGLMPEQVLTQDNERRGAQARIRPIRAYHGSLHDFDVFDPALIGSGATDGRFASKPYPAFYFTTSPEHAALYGKPIEFLIHGRLASVDARRELSQWARENGYRSAQEMINRYYDGSVYSALDADEFFLRALRDAQSAGFDGVRIRFGDLKHRVGERTIPLGDVLVLGRSDIVTRVR